jgi:hypothetical protein
MLTPLKPELLNAADSAAQTATFRAVAAAFRRNAALLLAGSAFSFEIDDEALARAFGAWRYGLDEVMEQAQSNRRDLLIFAGGMLLKELFQHRPLRIRPRGVAVLRSFPEAMTAWPEGYAYASYCFCVAAAGIEQEGLAALQPATAAQGTSQERQFWSSFRENVQEDARTAIGFFDLLCGVTPNWELPFERRVPVPG